MAQTDGHRRARAPWWHLHEHVVLARVGSLTIVNFGVFAGLGAFVATWVVLARQHQAGLPVDRLMWWLAALAPALALIGSRLYALVLLERHDLVRDPVGTLARTTLAWQGGFAAVTAGVLVIALAHGIDPLLWVDTFAFGVPLGQALGRLGCHSYGCCHGRPALFGPTVTVHTPLSKVVWGSNLGGVPLIPAPLYSALANVILALVLAGVASLGPHPAGLIAALYLGLDAVKRYLLEHIRVSPTAPVGGLTPFQWVALGQAVVAVVVAAVIDPNVQVDFATGARAAFAHALAWWPACAVTGLGMFLLLGVHRGEPGSLTRERR